MIDNELLLKFRGIEFVPIADAPLYFVSRCGKIMSLSKSSTSPRLLQPKDDGRGYKQVCLVQGERHVNKYVHRLVGHAWLPREKRPGQPHINHKNGNKSDNRVKNLEWVSPKENMAHASDTGLWNKRRAAERMAALNDISVRELRKMRAGGAKLKSLAQRFGISQGAVSMACNRKTWAHIP